MTAQPKHGYDGNSPEFMPTRDLESIDRWTGQRKREQVDGPTNTNSTRVSWLFHHGHITLKQFNAADKLANDFHMGQIMPYAQMGIIAGGAGRPDYTPAQAKIEAMQRFNRAMEELGRCSAKARRIIDLVVVQDRTVQKAASIMHIHHQGAKEALEISLDILARHYKLA